MDETFSLKSNNKYLKYNLNDEKQKNNFIVQFEKGNLNGVIRELGHVQSQIDENVAIISTSYEDLEKINKKKALKWVGLFKPHYKFSVKNIENSKKPFNSLPKKNIIDGSENYNFLIKLSSFLTPKDAEKIANDWKQEYEKKKISKDFDIELQNEKNSLFLNLIIIPKKNTQSSEITDIYDQVLKFFAEKVEVFYVELKMKISLFNFNAKSILQSGFRNITENRYNFVYRNGITGKDQVVGVTDTGLNVCNCYFYDSNPVPYDSPSSTHRKIKLYQKLSKTDYKDYTDGHGTHVCGSVAGSIAEGSSETDLSNYNGIAPNAKIAFVDLQNEAYPGLRVPSDTNSNLFPIPYSAGARIISNSWGASSPVSCSYDCSCDYSSTYCKQVYGRNCCNIGNSYDSMCQSVDEFLYNHPDTVILFAAGNQGTTSRFGNLGSPTTSKNVLSVGASTTTFDGMIKSTEYEDIQSNINLIQQYEYPVSTEAECCSYSGFNYEIIRSLCCPETMKTEITNKPNIYNQNNMADFSSRGPVFDESDMKVFSRIKPDISSPGNKIISAHSKGITSGAYYCGTERPSLDNDAALLSMQGTSMATPLLAGALALVREYFSKNIQKHEINPKSADASGVLLKALAIHSAQPMSGIVLLDGSSKILNLNQTFPNEFNGFGLTDLSFILPFENEQKLGNQPNFQIWVENLEYFNKIDTERMYTFILKKKKIDPFVKYLRITLVWYDYPSEPATVTASTILKGDIDLELFLNGQNKFFYGNNKNPDYVNTVERIHVEGAELEEDQVITIKIKKGSRFLIEKVPFSLVVSSNIEIEPIYTCFGKDSNSTDVCSGNGKCVSNDNCVCSSGFTGDQCQYYTCFGMTYNSPDVCSKHGTCLSPDNCKCTDGFFEKDCSVTKCFEILSNDTNVCSGNGICQSIDNCSCKVGYSEDKCEFFSCYNIGYNETNVCSGRGTCTSPNNCKCINGYGGTECQSPVCFDILSTDAKVCSGHGICSSPNICECNPEYYEKDCSVTTCFEIFSNETKVCSTNGICDAFNHCTCVQGYEGKVCNIFSSSNPLFSKNQLFVIFILLFAFFN